MRDCPRKKYSDDRKKRDVKESLLSRERQRKESTGSKEEPERRILRQEKISSPMPEKMRSDNRIGGLSLKTYIRL